MKVERNKGYYLKRGSRNIKIELRMKIIKKRCVKRMRKKDV